MKDKIADTLNNMAQEEDGISPEFQKFMDECKKIEQAAMKRARDTTHPADVCASVAISWEVAFNMIAAYNNSIIPTMKQIDTGYFNNIGLLLAKISKLEDRVKSLEAKK